MSRPMIEEKTLSDMCAGLRRRGGRWRRLVGDDPRTPGDAQPSAPTPGQRVAPVTELQQSESGVAREPEGDFSCRGLGTVAAVDEVLAGGRGEVAADRAGLRVLDLR